MTHISHFDNKVKRSFVSYCYRRINSKETISVFEVFRSVGKALMENIISCLLADYELDTFYYSPSLAANGIRYDGIRCLEDTHKVFASGAEVEGKRYGILVEGGYKTSRYLCNLDVAELEMIYNDIVKGRLVKKGV